MSPQLEKDADRTTDRLRDGTPWSTLGDIIVCYHGVTDSEPDPYLDRFNITLKDFDGQLEELARSFDFVSLDDLVDDLVLARASRRPRAVITFDDAFASVVHHLFPSLLKRGIPFTVSVPGGLVQEGRSIWGLELDLIALKASRPNLKLAIGPERVEICLPLGHRHERIAAATRLREEAWGSDIGPFRFTGQVIEDFGVDEFEGLAFHNPRIRLASREQLREWQAKHVTVACHGLYHMPLPQRSVPELRREVIEGRTVLEETLGLGPVEHFVPPYGMLDGPVSDLIKTAGYKSCLTTVDRGVQSGDHALALPRINSTIRGGQLARFLLESADDPPRHDLVG